MVRVASMDEARIMKLRRFDDSERKTIGNWNSNYAVDRSVSKNGKRCLIFGRRVRHFSTGRRYWKVTNQLVVNGGPE